MKGKIKWYSDKRGYGFIEGEDGNEVFLHYSQIPQGTSFSEGDDIFYKIEKTKKGIHAVNVKKI